MVIGHWSLVIGHWLLVIGHWSLVIGHWSLVIGHWSFREPVEADVLGYIGEKGFYPMVTTTPAEQCVASAKACTYMSQPNLRDRIFIN
ncbi:MAG: hypothetical protein F6K31_23975 [Symploca sp. SIO2G7]|nr:hypothetical protein [Symploca sp. SIO2G7]